MISIYADGACPVTSKLGGWAIIVVKDELEILCKEWGNARQVTNNYCELQAVILALKWIHTFSPDKPCLVFSDSEYVVKGINSWLAKWKTRNWKASTGPVKNRELWEAIDVLLQGIQVEVRWVKGHATCKYNNMADELAVEARKKLETK